MCWILFLEQYYYFSWKYSFTSFTTVPDNKNSVIKFGIAINPLNVSAILQSIPRSTVAPRMATREYTNIKGLITLEENKNSIQRAPYNPQPMMRAENAKQQRATAQ